MTASISLAEKDGAVTISTNGKPDAMIAMKSDVASADEVTMVLAGCCLAMHPQALERCQHRYRLGSDDARVAPGRTADVGGHDRDRSLHDRSSAARILRSRIAHVHRLRSHLHVEDAKTFFATHRKRYDIIVSEPSNPWVSGVSSLFSVEFYRDIKPFLEPNGLFVQWLQIYETDLTTVASVAEGTSDAVQRFCAVLGRTGVTS